jgi:hypothetical protein
MAEINIKSPALQDRDIGTYKFSAKVTWNGPSCCCSSTIDIPGLTIASCACCVDKFVISGFECAADVAIDTSRAAGLAILNTGTLTGVTEGEIGAAATLGGVIAGTAGSRTITYQLAGAFTSATDALTNAIFEFTIPIKNKDF